MSMRKSVLVLLIFPSKKLYIICGYNIYFKNQTMNQVITYTLT